jgi:hypothetical protein
MSDPDAPSGAPAPNPDLERHPRTRMTRLPYIVVVLIALVVIAIWGVATTSARRTADQQMNSLNASPSAAGAPADPRPPQ